MTKGTKIKPEFAEAVMTAMGGLAVSKVVYKTSISYEYLRRMKHGQVPSEDIIHQFATGLSVDVMPLLVAAGYAKPEGLEDAIEFDLRVYGNTLSGKAKEQILDFIRQVKAEEEERLQDQDG
jgi:hypothetical protein